MLEEIIACFLSLFSALTLDAPRLSRKMNDNASPSDQCTHSTWEQTIYREYVSFEEENLPSETENVQPGYELGSGSSHAKSLLRSLKMNFTITLAVLPLVLIGMALIYFDLRTVDLCSEWEAKNYTLSFNVWRIRLIGIGVEKMLLYLLFFMTLVVLFGWNELKRHYSSTILVGFLVGLFNTLYVSFLLIYGIHDTGPLKSYDVVPPFLAFPVALFWESAIVMRHIRQNHPTVSYSSRHIFMVLVVPLLSTNALAIFYRYAVVIWFNSFDNVWYRFILAILTPTLALVPTAICRHMALWRTSEMIKPERSFV
ncbi:Hypothetical predicted protein, partial [Paramuricea clavata]